MCSGSVLNVRAVVRAAEGAQLPVNVCLSNDILRRVLGVCRALWGGRQQLAGNAGSATALGVSMDFVLRVLRGQGVLFGSQLLVCSMCLCVDKYS